MTARSADEPKPTLIPDFISRSSGLQSDSTIKQPDADMHQCPVQTECRATLQSRHLYFGFPIAEGEVVPMAA
jgi:hypothetical protein